LFHNLCNRSPLHLHPEGKDSACIAFAALAVYLWVLPTGGTIALRNLAFAGLIFITLWSAWRYKLRLHFPLAWPWLAYSLIAVVSLSYAANPLLSLGEIKHEIGYGILILMLMATWVRNRRALEFVLAAIILGDIFLVGASLFKVTEADPFWRHPLAEINALLHEGPGKDIYNGAGNFSTYLVTVMPFMAAYTFFQPSNRLWVRNSLTILLLLNVITIFLTGNRMGLMVLVAETLFAVAFLAITRSNISGRRMLIFPVIALTLIGGLGWTQFQLRPPVDDPRWPIWAWGVKDLFAAPLTGSGFGRTTLCTYDPAFCTTFQLEHAHNMILNKGVQMGFPGIIAFLLLLATTLHALWPRRSLAADTRLWGYALAATTMCVGVFLKNMTDDFFISHNALLFWALVGAVSGAIAGEQEHAEPSHP